VAISRKKIPKRISTATRHRTLHQVEAHQPEIAVLTVAQEAAVVAVVAAADGVAEADIMDAAMVDMAVRGTNRLRKNPISLLFLGPRLLVANGGRGSKQAAEKPDFTSVLGGHDFEPALSEAKGWH